MKRLALALAIIAFVGLSAAVVNENGSSNECPPGQMCIQSTSSSSSASGTVAVGPNGTQYESQVSMTNSKCLEPPANNLTNVSFSGQDSAKKGVSFEGEVRTPNPCYNIESETTEVKPGVYRLNMTVVEPDREEPCTQCIGGIEYEASFEADQPFKLEVVHDGENIDTLEHPGYEQDNSDTGDNPQEPGNSSFMAGIIDWFNNLI